MQAAVQSDQGRAVGGGDGEVESVATSDVKLMSVSVSRRREKVCAGDRQDREAACDLPVERRERRGAFRGIEDACTNFQGERRRHLGDDPVTDHQTARALNRQPPVHAGCGVFRRDRGDHNRSVEIGDQ